MKAKTVYDLFNGHPERWTKKAMARTDKGGECAYNSPKACRWCVLGAIYYIYPTSPTGNLSSLDKGFKMADKLRCVLPILQITEWADSKSLTFDQMLNKIKEAGI